MNLLRPLTKENSIFLVIDVQNDFCSKEGIFGNRGNFSKIDGTIDNIIEISSKLEEKKFEIFYFKQLYDPENMPTLKCDLSKRRGTPSCDIKTNGHDFYRINPQKDRVFVKYGYDCFANEEFMKYLKEKDIDSIIVSGFDTHICVETTIRSGFDKGYQMVLLTNCVGSRAGKKRHIDSINSMSMYFAVPMRSTFLYEIIDLPSRKQRNYYKNNYKDNGLSSSQRQLDFKF